MLALLACLPGSTSPQGVAPVSAPGESYVQNASFEEDWIQAQLGHRKRFMLLHASDLGVGEGDGLPDYWKLTPGVTWETSRGHSGSRCLRLSGKSEAYQRLRLVSETSERSGGSYYAAALPMEAPLASQIAPRPLVVGAWCRTEGAATAPQLVVELDCKVRPGTEPKPVTDQGKQTRAVSFSAGSHDWEYRELTIDPAHTPFFAKISLQSSDGTVWFDDVSCQEPPPGLLNLLPQGAFDGPDLTGWSEPRPWSWFRTDYYNWTGWSHPPGGRARGTAALDSLVRWSGSSSLRMTALPGDSFALASKPVLLRQSAARPLEVRAMVRADNLRGFEIMAQDENGAWLPQGDFLGDDLETDPGLYDMGSTALGTHPWICVRKFFSPRRALSGVRLFVCIRGFDGVRVPRNRVATAWVDQLQLFEHGTGPASVQPAAVAGLPFRATDVDLGDRMWGNNVMRFRLAGELPRKAELELIGPDGKRQVSPGRWRGQVLEFPYRIERLCRSWQEQFSARISLDGKALEELSFGTPTHPLEVGVASYYVYPSESQTVYARLNVARDSFPELGALELKLNGRVLERLERLERVLEPHTGPPLLDTSHLCQVSFKRTDQPVHPWREPTRDLRLEASLPGLQSPEPVSFGYLEPMPESDLPASVKTSRVTARGYLEVDGKPYFPVCWTPHFGILPEANYPPPGLKSVDLTQAVQAGESLEPLVKAARQDPALFQYLLGPGEMNLQSKLWQLDLSRYAKAIETIHRLDPDHLVNGSLSWLVGAPHHQADMPKFQAYWDAIGVEASFEEYPAVTQLAGHPCAVLAGLEAYYYQSLEMLRWRGYESVIHGCAGVGLCPSGMLQARPDMVSFLRGLDGEFRGLGPVLAGGTGPSLVAPPGFDCLAREGQGHLYLLVARDGAGSGPARGNFRLPAGSSATVLFEARRVKLSEGVLQDDFATPHTVHVYRLD